MLYEVKYLFQAAVHPALVFQLFALWLPNHARAWVKYAGLILA